jgi:hypothetical protein
VVVERLASTKSGARRCLGSQRVSGRLVVGLAARGWRQSPASRTMERRMLHQVKGSMIAMLLLNFAAHTSAGGFMHAG